MTVPFLHTVPPSKQGGADWSTLARCAAEAAGADLTSSLGVLVLALALVLSLDSLMPHLPFSICRLLLTVSRTAAPPSFSGKSTTAGSWDGQPRLGRTTSSFVTEPVTSPPPRALSAELP
jgi:hypothetical protein